MSFVDTMREILEAEGLLKHDTQKARPASSAELPGKPGDAVRTQARADTAAWLSAWREVARLTTGITQEDRRFQLVMTALKPCDAAFERGNWPAFQRALAQVRLVIQMEHDQ